MRAGHRGKGDGHRNKRADDCPFKNAVVMIEVDAKIIVAPTVLGEGKRVEGFTKSLELEHIGLRQSPFATFIDCRVKRS